jgi:type 1 glutamine amidotransferase
MTRRLGLLATAAAVVLLAVVAYPGAQSAPAAVKILFLGHHSEHHNSAKFEPMLASALASEHVIFDYSEDPADLNPTRLASYDGLMIYANHTSITPEQEKALLDYVLGGKAFLPIHAASYCFQNSPAYIALVGAQFQKHGTGEFTAEIVKPEHPVMGGLQPFQVWDETYVHTKHNTDRIVLMERVDEAGREPWTWVRTHGKGRVFYTAYGHDERVWGHPMFHKLILNAIRWAAQPAGRAH